jgi:hypothetical protein
MVNPGFWHGLNEANVHISEQPQAFLAIPLTGNSLDSSRRLTLGKGRIKEFLTLPHNLWLYLEASFGETVKRYGGIEEYLSEGSGIDAASQKALQDLSFLDE